MVPAARAIRSARVDDAAARAAGWRRYLERNDHDRESLLVVESGGEVVGFANVGPCRDPEPAGAGEVYAIYLLAEWWGRGAGRDLMAAALDALVGCGFAEATLWVLDANFRARRFYEAGGWAVDGSSRVEEGFGFPIAEVRYRRHLP
jgi:GNAT superfamily N-acetyltransferase